MKTAGFILGPKHGSIDKLTGPYVFSGGWWNREIQREYYYAETRRGDFLWLYYDRVRRRWFLQGDARMTAMFKSSMVQTFNVFRTRVLK